MDNHTKTPKGCNEKFNKLTIVGWSDIPYISPKGEVHHKVDCMCECGNKTSIIHQSVLHNKIKSCGCSRRDKPPKGLGLKFGLWTILGWGQTIHRKNRDIRMISCRCDCGVVCDVDHSSVIDGRSSSCGCVRRSEWERPKHLGKKFGKLTIIGYGARKTGKSKWMLCRCDCGNICEKVGGNLLYNEVYSCGCSRVTDKRIISRIGQKIGKLTILSISDKKINHCICYDVACDCGAKTIWKSGSNARSCGNCCNIKNGRFTSSVNFKLHEMLGGEHNYYTDVRCGPSNQQINVDIALVEEKIAIEYDNKYWHRNKVDKDNVQTQKLISGGWKVLRIKSNRNLPTKEEIQDRLNRLRNNESNLEIIEVDD